MPILAQLCQCTLARKKYACKGTAVTSEYFRANLGLLDSDAAGMLDPWCQRTYEQLHRQRSFGGVCPHGILSPTQVPQVDSDGNPDRILQFRTSAEQLARRWCGVVDGRSIRKSARSRTE